MRREPQHRKVSVKVMSLLMVQAASAMAEDPKLEKRWLKRTCDVSKPDLIEGSDYNWPVAFAAWKMSGETI